MISPDSEENYLNRTDKSFNQANFNSIEYVLICLNEIVFYTDLIKLKLALKCLSVHEYMNPKLNEMICSKCTYVMFYRLG